MQLGRAVFVCALLAWALLPFVSRVRFVLTDDRYSFPSMQLSAQHCTAVRGPRGLEDFVEIAPGIVLASELDLLRLEHGVSAATDMGGDFDGDIWQLNTGAAAPALVRVLRVDYPANVRFHPHGLGYLPEDRLLFVVNHAFAHGGERIDVFRVELAGNNVTLHYQHAVVFGVELMGTLNDVAPVSADEFYVTQWRPSPLPSSGRDPSGLQSLLEVVYFILNPFQLRWTHMRHCVGAADQASCRVVGPSGIAWNGIVVLDALTVVAADVFAVDSLAVFDRDVATGNLALRYKVPDISKVDNLMVAADGDLWTAGVTLFPETHAMVLAAAADPATTIGNDTRGRFKAGAQAIRLRVAHNATVRYSHDGALLAGWSVAFPTGGYLLAGSFFDDGMLLCAIPDLVDGVSMKLN